MVTNNKKEHNWTENKLKSGRSADCIRCSLLFLTYVLLFYNRFEKISTLFQEDIKANYGKQAMIETCKYCKHDI